MPLLRIVGIIEFLVSLEHFFWSFRFFDGTRRTNGRAFFGYFERSCTSGLFLRTLMLKTPERWYTPFPTWKWKMVSYRRQSPLLRLAPFSTSMIIGGMIMNDYCRKSTLPEIIITPENWWLEDDPFRLGWPGFGFKAMLVSGYRRKIMSGWLLSNQHPVMSKTLKGQWRDFACLNLKTSEMLAEYSPIHVTFINTYITINYHYYHLHKWYNLTISTNGRYSIHEAFEHINCWVVCSSYIHSKLCSLNLRCRSFHVPGFCPNVPTLRGCVQFCHPLTELFDTLWKVQVVYILQFTHIHMYLIYIYIYIIYL